MSLLIKGAMLARFSPAPRLSLVLPLHDSSKTGHKTSQGFPNFLLVFEQNFHANTHILAFLINSTEAGNLLLTPEFRLKNEVGITGDVRQEPLSFELDDKECFGSFLQNNFGSWKRFVLLL